MFAASSSPDLKQCACGYPETSRSTETLWSLMSGTVDQRRMQCGQKGLKNHVNFPSFADLPDENDIDLDYYSEDDTGYCFRPCRHWCYVAEIVEAWKDVRYRIHTKTRFEESVLINFHLDDAIRPTFFEWDRLRSGHTICILYANARTFMDGNRGIRQEYSRNAMVFPVVLDALTREIDAIQYSLARELSGCAVCGTEQPTLSRCARCHLVRYCSKECQTIHWRQGHNKLCAHSQMLKSLATLDFSKFDGFQDWGTLSTVSWTSASASGSTLPREGPSALHPVLQLLQAIGGKLVGSDEITSPIVTTEGVHTFRQLLRDFAGNDDLSTPVDQTFIHRGLAQLCMHCATDSAVRSHVADLVGLDHIEHSFQNSLINVIVLALPKWQQSLGIRGIAWAIEAHNVMGFETCFDKATWNRLDDQSGIVSDSCLVRHTQSGVTAFWADSTTVVSEIARELAFKHADRCIVRILRATPNRTDEVGRVLAQSMPPNVFTLWIREEPPLCGKFAVVTDEKLSASGASSSESQGQPLDDGALRAKLLNCRDYNPIEQYMSMLNVMTGDTSNSGGKSTSQTQHRETHRSRRGVKTDGARAGPMPTVQIQPDDSLSSTHVRCHACRRKLCAGDFSKTQLRKPPHSRKCRVCTDARMGR
eukprot:1321655-Rhodomonas_salina.2